VTSKARPQSDNERMIMLEGKGSEAFALFHSQSIGEAKL